jgi:SMC interacting uncharacterized protein involved in chromosome segregation
MISELNDDEILDFLMTSEFEDDYSPSELKYLLVKWRYFYRLLYGNLERNKLKFDSDTKELKEEVENNKIQISNLKSEISSKENTIGSLKNRRLSLKERLTGKIIVNEDEN